MFAAVGTNVSDTITPRSVGPRTRAATSMAIAFRPTPLTTPATASIPRRAENELVFRRSDTAGSQPREASDLLDETPTEVLVQEVSDQCSNSNHEQERKDAREYLPDD
jgi:hypothetical protein